MAHVRSLSVSRQLLGVSQVSREQQQCQCQQHTCVRLVDRCTHDILDSKVCCLYPPPSIQQSVSMCFKLIIGDLKQKSFASVETMVFVFVLSTGGIPVWKLIFMIIIPSVTRVMDPGVHVSMSAETDLLYRDHCHHNISRGSTPGPLGPACSSGHSHIASIV